MNRIVNRRELRKRAGVTLIEMLVVVTIIGVIAGVSMPAITAGLDGVRLQTGAGLVASFITMTLNGVERHEEPAVVVVSPKENSLDVFTAPLGEKPNRSLKLPQGLSFDGEEQRRYVLYPGGTAPQMVFGLHNAKGARRAVTVDPVTGIPRISRPGLE